MTNKFLQPFIVSGVPRSGTSMVTGLIHKHGAWCGTCREADEFNPKGYFENTKIRDLITSNDKIFVSEFPNMVYDTIKEDGYDDTFWVYKENLNRIHVWYLSGFRPIVIFVRRDFLHSVDSYTKHIRANSMSDEDVFEKLKNKKRWMDSYLKSSSEIVVDYKDLIDGRYDALAKALQKGGLELNKSICDQFIDKGLNHHV